MRVGVLDAKTRKFRVEDIRDELDEYYKIIGCDTIDIVSRKVFDDTWFDIICDDEGLLKEAPEVTALNSEFQPMLVGTLIFAHHNKEGETTGITPQDEELLHIATLSGYLWPCDYE